uniref:Ribonuclease A-domain domain-containing protein n=1 Tax=Oryzias latipes TaxID=8090 RepID=A0A3P9M0B5_ORYLA
MKILLKSRYEKFRRQHIDKHMTANKCDSVMNRKNIFNNDNSCKETNTFIVDDPAKVKRICEGIADGKMMQSTEMFRIVKCELKNTGARKPNCQYKGGLLTNRYLKVKCENKLPVHFDDDIVNFGF